MEALQVVIESPGQVVVDRREVSTDDLGAHEVVIEAGCSVISPGTELAHYRGDSHNGVLAHTAGRSGPFLPGYAMAGAVVAAGPEAGVAVGARVLAHTPHASLSRFDRQSVVCTALPDGVDERVAPFARLAQVSGVSLQLSMARPGDLVAVVGLGAIGNLAAQLAKASAMTVVGIDLSDFRRHVAADCGIDQVAWAAEAPAMFAALGGARVVLECSGRAAGVALAAAVCGRYGEIFTVGAPWTADADVVASTVVAPVFEKYLSLRSGWEWQVPRYAGEGQRSIAACTAWILGLLADGTLVTRPLVTDTVAPVDTPDAYHMLATAPDQSITCLINWRAGI